MSLEWWEDACFHLRWTQHGGSGLGRSYQELLEMPADQIIRDLDRVTKQRQWEIDELKKARAAAPRR